ncbi:uncharacterized protein LOC113468105 [Diaphorina citri]|uniref:Uncharacterized protein LOC113468105 n=1 Tax=Diaphorina citri TaxID=121845 RepID=A0A3Q0J1I3_DIACI|nr:uncharacterized protein LOC113468105 [Diaphorina citri]
MSRNHNKVNSNDVEDDEESLENFDSEEYSSGLKERDAALSNEENLLKNSYRNEYMVTNINSTRSKETINRKMIILNDSEEDQISSETNTEDSIPTSHLGTYLSVSKETFLPKKKTGEPAIAQTITRGITPTIVATPALKATSINNVFGASSRNRFAVDLTTLRADMPYLIYPTVDSQEFDILPSSVQEINGEYLTSTGDFDLPVLKDILSNSQDDILETSEARNIVSPTDPSERTPSIEKEEDESPKDSRENSERVPDSENVISVKKEYSSSKNNGEIVKPQKVKPKANLPTYTVKNSYDSFLFEDDLITEEPKYDTNQLFRKPVIIKNDINFEAIAKKQQRISKSLLFNRNKDREAQKEKDQPTANQQEKTSEKSKLVTTTYFGFADFTTTVGSTVIHFMPHTPAAVPNSLVTSIKGKHRRKKTNLPPINKRKVLKSQS